MIFVLYVCFGQPVLVDDWKMGRCYPIVKAQILHKPSRGCDTS
jgi:hypothetical protein